jgi:hypothetical protein
MMATMRFSVPPDIKAAFAKAFAGADKSAVLTRLMRQAIDDRERQRRRALAIDRLLAVRRESSPNTSRAIRAARVRART